jgi:hypothetical protein
MFQSNFLIVYGSYKNPPDPHSSYPTFKKLTFCIAAVTVGHVSQVDDSRHGSEAPSEHVYQAVGRESIFGPCLRATEEQAELHEEREHEAENQNCVNELVEVDEHL